MAELLAILIGIFLDSDDGGTTDDDGDRTRLPTGG
jgi:hypothetical protein